LGPQTFCAVAAGRRPQTPEELHIEHPSEGMTKGLLKQPRTDSSDLGSAQETVHVQGTGREHCDPLDTEGPVMGIGGAAGVWSHCVPPFVSWKTLSK
jgi:hypothetical protein